MLVNITLEYKDSDPPNKKDHIKWSFNFKKGLNVYMEKLSPQPQVLEALGFTN